MSRIPIKLPEPFIFTCTIPVRITDINYGGHLGNDSLLGIIHEARMQFLASLGYSEMEFGGTGMIMSDAAIEFKGELFYGDILIVSISVGEISRVGFELFYKLEKQIPEKKVVVAIARTGMICYDYKVKKIVSVPADARVKLLG
jgi:acyl-CoA thioesterase FadM